MDITKTFNHILNDWDNLTNRINDVIRYNFQIDNYRIAVSYTKVNGLENQLSITWFLDNQGIVLPFDIIKKDNTYQMNTYIPTQYFSILAQYIDFSKPGSMNQYMDKIFSHVSTIHPVIYDYSYYRREYLEMDFQNITDKPFFKCFIRKSISSDMEKKIWRKYSNAAEIISFCKKTNQTLRFSRDINKAKDFSVEFENAKLKIN